jgi:hypothetical protein
MHGQILVGALKKFSHELFQRRGYLQFILPLGFLVVMLIFFPFRERFEFDPDEGINLMKAMLVVRGYPLYTEIWSDQPPLFTFLLAACIKILGPDVNNARMLVLLHSAVLLWGACHFLLNGWGAKHSAIGAIFLFMLPYYTSLSTSVMIGLPALTYAMLAFVALSAWHRQSKDVWLILSAFLLACSVFMKIITGFLAPIFLAGIVLQQYWHLARPLRWRPLVWPALIWFIVFCLSVLGMSLTLIGPSHMSQLITTHLVARSVDLFTSYSKTFPLTWYLQESWPFLLLASFSLPSILRSKYIPSMYLIAWPSLAFLLLFFHVPVWYHHQLLITIPVALLASIAVGEVLQAVSSAFRNHRYQLLAPIAILAVLGILFNMRAKSLYLDFVLPAYLIKPEAQSEGREVPFIEEISKRASKIGWLLTDSPMYAFRAGVVVPPPLAVISDKRFMSGELSEQQLINYLDSYNPGMVLIGRFKLTRLEAYVRNSYRQIYYWGKRRLYLRGDLKRSE